MWPGQFIGLSAKRRARLLVADDPEDVLLVVLEVPRGLVRLLVVEERRLHLEVAAAAVLAPAQVLERVPDHHALRVPERRARRALVEVEEVELHAEPAVVARASPPRGARGTRRGPSGRRTRCRRCASAACSSRRRASTRRRGSVSFSALIGFEFWRCGPAAEVGEVALRVEADLRPRRCRRARACRARRGTAPSPRPR